MYRKMMMISAVCLLVIALFAQGCTQAPEEKMMDKHDDEMKDEMDKEEMMDDEEEMMDDKEEMDDMKEMDVSGSYTINSEASTLQWTSKRLAASPHVGTVDISSGSLELSEGNIVSGNYVMDMNTIDEPGGNERFIAHVKNEDFFAVEEFPESRFVITGYGDGMLTGDLTIKDQTNSISFPVDLVAEGNTLSATASFSIDRTKWGIVYDSGSFFSELGDRAIKDDIDFELDLLFEAN